MCHCSVSSGLIRESERTVLRTVAQPCSDTTMLAIPDISDWVEGIIVLVIIAGSALSGIVKAIITKLNRSREEVEAERELQERPPPQRMTQRPTVPPVARPMPPRRPAATLEHRPVARPMMPQRPTAEIPKSLQPMVQTILDVVLDGAVDVEDVFGKPKPRPTPPPAPPRTAKATVPKRPARRRSIEDREEQKAKLVEKRIGHVETHVASATPTSTTDADFEWFERPTRTDLRRAIILNEILSPPLALRRTE